MKKRLFAALALACLLTAAAPAGEIIAAWDFADLPKAPETPTTIPATVGEGELDATSLSPEGRNPELTSATGTAAGAFEGGESGAGTALLIANWTANMNPIFVRFSMSGHRDLQLSYQYRATDTGFERHEWEVSTDGENFTQVELVELKAAEFIGVEIDLSEHEELNDAPEVHLRLTMDGATHATGNNRIDNLVLRATPQG